MSDSIQSLLFGPNQLRAAIASFSESVASYLIPTVLYVGSTDHVFDSLQRQFSGLVHEHSYSGLPAHVVVFSELALESLSDLANLHPDSAYVFCSHRPNRFNNEEVSVLRRHVSITLNNPSIEDLIWHIRAILFISDVSYRNTEAVIPSMISADRKFRKCLSTLIDAALNLNSCFLLCSGKSLREDIERFIFDSTPSLLQPYRIDPSRLDVDALPSTRTSLVSMSTSSECSLDSLYTTLAPALINKPLIALLDCDDTMSMVAENESGIQYIPSLESRYPDACLIAYWCAAAISHGSATAAFYSKEQLGRALARSNSEPNAFIEDLLGQLPEDPQVDEMTVSLIQDLNRFSIDDVFDAAERNVMQILKDRSNFVDAASGAAGIPTVTFHKRIRRLIEKQTLLSILGESRRVD